MIRQSRTKLLPSAGSFVTAEAFKNNAPSAVSDTSANMNFEPERRMSRKEHSKAEKRETAGRMDGTQVSAKLFKFSVIIIGREAPKNLRIRILVGAKRPRN